jgi:putative phosphoesterase
MQRTDSQKDKYVIGVLSDTHGLLRPEVLAIFSSVDLILHAGDIGGPDILESLEQVAPVMAVRGNMDYGSWAEDLPKIRRLALGEKQLFVIHDAAGFHMDSPSKTNIHVVVSGHTHRSHIERRNGRLYLNPGSAGYRRRLYSVSVGLLRIENGCTNAEIVTIEP